MLRALAKTAVPKNRRSFRDPRRTYPTLMLLRVIAEGCVDPGTVLDHLVVLHPKVKGLHFGNSEIL